MFEKCQYSNVECQISVGILDDSVEDGGGHLFAIFSKLPCEKLEKS